MRVLVTGSTGFIGSAVCGALIAQGHQPIYVSRRPVPNREAVILDMADVLAPAACLPHLVGTDAVVNCAGVLQDSAQEKTREVHHLGVAALFKACEMVLGIFWLMIARPDFNLMAWFAAP